MEAITIAGKDYQPERVIELAKRSASWFGGIAALSAINTVIHLLFRANVLFVVGLGASMFVDGFVGAAAQEAQSPTSTFFVAAGLLLNLFFISVFVAIWWLSRKGNRTAHIVGSLIYMLDGLIFVVLRDWVSFGFHVFVLLMLLSSYRFVKARPAAEKILADEAARTSSAQPAAD